MAASRGGRPGARGPVAQGTHSKRQQERRQAIGCRLRSGCQHRGRAVDRLAPSAWLWLACGCVDWKCWRGKWTAGCVKKSVKKRARPACITGHTVFLCFFFFPFCFLQNISPLTPPLLHSKPALQCCGWCESSTKSFALQQLFTFCPLFRAEEDRASGTRSSRYPGAPGLCCC